MFISVIVPVYNRENYIGRCLNALIAQDFCTKQYEIICIDNGSDDNTASVVSSCDRVHLLYEPKRGAYHARNLGITHAKGDIIAFTDSDCVVSGNWLQKIGEAFRAKHTQVVLGSRKSAGRGRLLNMADHYENMKKAFIVSREKPELVFGHTNNMAIRGQLFQEIGQFKPIMRGADTVFVNQVVQRHFIKSIRYLPEMCVEHLELRSLLDYYRKIYTFGKSSRRYTLLTTSHRQFTLKENLEVFTISRSLQNLNALQALSLLGILLIGKCCWTVGRVRKSELWSKGDN